jgi:tyrosyl-tRNA synthetase
MANAEVLAKQSNDAAFKDIWEELKWRGLIALSTDEGELHKALSSGSITFYCGFDPTAPSLHLGNLVQLLVMRRLQLAGHTPIVLIGGATGLIGDPKPTAERVLNEKETVAAWVTKLENQAKLFLSFEGKNKASLVNNLDWTESLSSIDFLRDVGKHFRVGKMLSKDAVSARLNSDAGISFTEFAYQILQGMDYLELYRRNDCILQIGGSDQWGNLTSGTDLIHKVEGKSAHILATPLITDSTGKKFGKSEGNAIWLDANATSPYAFYQFWLNVEDAIVINLLKVFTFISKAEIAELEKQLANEPHLRAAQKRLALEVTTLVHSAEDAESAILASQALFGQGDLDSLDDKTLQAALTELPHQNAQLGEPIVDLLVKTELVQSNSAGRRAIAEGGVYLNNIKVEQESAVLDSAIRGKFAVLRRGKKTLAGIFIQNS